MRRITPEDMICLVLCAGQGTRMRPLTLTRPKQLLRLCNVAVLDHIFAAVREAGITKVGLIVDPEADMLRNHVGDGSRFGVEIGWAVQQKAQGIAHALLAAKDLVAGRPFMVYLGDALYSNRITGFVQEFTANYPAGLVRLAEVEDPRQYGVAKLDGEANVVSVVEKPAVPPSNLAITGLYAFPPTFYDAIAVTEPSARGELEITDAIGNFLDSESGVRGETYTGNWADAGQPHHLLDASAAMLDVLPRSTYNGQVAGSEVTGQLTVGAETVIERCRIEGPVLIGENCRIVDATLGPHVSVGDGCTIETSTIRNSIIDVDATIHDVGAELVGCVVGVGAEVSGLPSEAGPLSTVVGDGAVLKAN